MYKILAKVKQEGELCEIYSDIRDSSKFSVGVVLDYDDDFMVYWALSPFGEDDGLSVVAIDDVYMIQTSTRYLEKVKILSLQQKTKEQVVNFGGSDVLHGALAYARDNNKICTAELGYEGGARICGKICTVEDGAVIVSLIDTYGKDDGYAYILEDDIGALSIESQSEVALKRLKLR